MDEALIIIIVIAVLAVGLLALMASRRRTETRQEEARYEATQTRDLADVAVVDADLQAAEADERAARAERERLAAEKQRFDAEQAHNEVGEMRARADEIDPDVDTAADPASRRDVEPGR